jgi:hypothetical protein
VEPENRSLNASSPLLADFCTGFTPELTEVLPRLDVFWTGWGEYEGVRERDEEVDAASMLKTSFCGFRCCPATVGVAEPRVRDC